MSAIVAWARKKTSRVMQLARKDVSQRFKYGLLTKGAERHVFVAGAQRSGTNMVMNVLERSTETAVFHERDERAFSNYLMRPPETIRKLSQGARAPWFVIKALCESQRVGTLMDEFAPAQTLWVFRHYPDVVNSMVRSFGKLAISIHNVAQQRSPSNWRAEGMSDETHAILRRCAQPGLDESTAAALLWYARNVLFFEQGLDRDPRTMLIRYESLVTEPEIEFGRAFRFLGLKYSARLSDDVSTASIKKRPAPDLDPEIASLCDELHERFAALHETQTTRPLNGTSDNAAR